MAVDRTHEGIRVEKSNVVPWGFVMSIDTYALTF